MKLEHCFIDLEKLPPDCRDALEVIAEKHSALVNFVGDLNQKVDINKNNVDSILGKSPEEKEDMKAVFQKARQIVKYLHSKRVDSLLFTVQAAMFVGFLKMIGVETEQVTKIVNLLIHFLEKLAGAPI